MKRRTVVLVLGILWQIFIFTQSMLTGEISSNQSGFIVDILYPFVHNIGIPIDGDNFSLLIRKLAHFTEYAILGLLWYNIYTLFILNKFLPWIVVIHGVLAATLDETIQRFTPNRSGELRDVFIDTLGVLTAVILILLIQKIRRKEVLI